MATWKEVTDRWLPIVEHMEGHRMDDYAIPEIYRAAEREITALKRENEAWRNGMNVYQMPHRSWEKGDWAYAYMGMISDGFDSEDDAITHALLIKETNDED